MKKINLLIVLNLFIATAIFSAGNNEASDNSDGKLKVFTSILPQKYFVEQIGGDRVDVSVLVTPGKSPATYQPTPNQIIDLSQSKALFTIGVPFENGFLDKVEDTLKDLVIVDSSNGITKREIDDHHHDEHEHDADEDHHDEDEHEHDADEDHHDEDEHEHDADEDHHDEDEHEHDADEDHHDEDEHEHEGGLDPHVWLSPVLAKEISLNIYNSLVELDPEGKEEYTAGYNELIAKLESVNNEIHEMLEPVEDNILFVYHPSFGYFADQYHLHQVAIETGGKEPTPALLAEIIEEAQEEGVHLIIVQPEFSKKSAQIIADSINGTVTTLNPLSDNYISNLKEIAEVILNAYK